MRKYFAVLPLLFFLTCSDFLSAQGELPVGSHPEAIAFDHFPNRVYALVWRNWNLVEPGRVAETIGCRAEDIHAIAASMGLPPAMEIPPDFKKRMYITVLRRNWHLLPYDQLLTLLDMSSAELEFSLREDDFLFIKLGSLKPACDPLLYSPPNKKELARAKQIKGLVRKHFKKALRLPAESRLAFVDQLSAMDNEGSDNNGGGGNNGGRAEAAIPKANEAGLRFIYSYFGVFGDPLIDTRSDPYPDGLLGRLAAKGVNGVWMHVVLNQMAPGGEDFPEFGARHKERIANLRAIVQRAKKYGIRVYLYINEPRAMPQEFFKDRPEMAGVREGDHIAMCTSDIRVKNWIGNSLTYIFKEVPDLGGVFTITASENLTNCASHGRQKDCPRCSQRAYADIIAGINKVIANGVHKGSPDAKVIAYDWGWHGHGDAPDVIARLPKSLWLMSVSEWARPFERGGIKSAVGEYSMSVTGPGPRARRHWALAKAAGLKTVAKVQFNNTWELSAVPWLPVADLVAEHAANLAKENIDGVMLSWSLGGYPSPNLQIAQAFADDPSADPGTVLDSLAAQRYGKAAALFAREAWTAFSKAFEQFPYGGNVLYKAPQQYGPANLLFPRSTGYSATMVGLPYDDLGGWRGSYPPEVFAAQFEKVAEGWKEGLALFNKVVRLSGKERQAIAVKDERIAKAAYLHFASVANQARFVISRDSLLNSDLAAEGERSLKKKINALLDNEIILSGDLFNITRQDSRIGFEASNQYYYVPQDLMEKVINCEFIRRKLL